MKCEILGTECAFRGGNCANCAIAAEALLKSVEDIQTNYKIEPIVIASDDNKRRIMASWAKNTIAEVREGKVIEFDL